MLLKMKIAVVGSRKFNDYDLLKEKLSAYQIDVIISGGAVGADLLAERYALENQIETLIFPADWDIHGRSAGLIRNKLIVESCDYLIAFWNGKSRGTKFSIDYAEALGKKAVIIYVQNAVQNE